MMSYSQNEVKSKLVSQNYSLNDRKLLNEIVNTNNNDNDNHQQANQTPLELSSSNGDDTINQEPWDNVYRLLQQLNDLRDANSKLQKKVQFLEGMKLLTKLHQDIRDDPEFSEFFSEFFRQKYNSLENRGDTEAASDDGVFINSENANIVSASKTTDESAIRSSANRTTRELRISTLARERSKSVGHEEILNQGERAKVITCKSKRFPRWSRVKTALGWDKTSQTNAPVPLIEKSDGKSKRLQNESTSGYGDAASNTSGSEFVNCDATSGCDIDKGFKLTGRGGSERRILGIKSIISSRKNSLNRSSIKSDSRSRKNDSEIQKKDNQDHKVSGEVDENDYDDCDNSVSQNSQIGISITLGSGIKGSKSLGDISSNSHSCSKYLVENLNRSGKSPTSSSSAIQKATKTKTGKTGTAFNTDSIIPSPHNDMSISSIDTTAICKYAKSRYRSIEGNNSTRWTGSQRMPSMSPPVKRRSKWIKMRKVFANASEGVPRSTNASLELNSTNVQSVPASPMSSDTSFNYVMAWNENETGSGEEGDGETANGYEAAFDTEGRLKEMDRSDDGECEKDDDYMLPLSESATEPVLNLVQELQRNLSEDFRKKIEEWEKIKSGEVLGAGSGAEGFGLGGSSTRMPVTAKVERKTSLPKLKKRKSDRKLEKYRAKYKDLNWVEKELTRANKEKEKLDRERAKFEERIKVLQKCKEDALATEKGTKKEVFVRTSEGEFRFEGITDDFTKKLYEWETKKGLCPESSIITLLDSSPGPSSCTTLGSPPSLEASLFDQEKSQIRSGATGRHLTRHPLNRCISRSESSLLDPLAENGLSAINKDQNSKITSTSLPSLQQVDPCSEYESVLLPAGVTKEDIDSRKAHLIRQQQQVARQLFNLESSSEFQPATIPVWGDGEKCMVTVNPDGSTIIVGSKQDIYEMTKEILGEAGDEGYISLLEANMFLLEKLNAKEDVCRNLEMQLKQLDSKMDEMNEKHRKEMEIYREKLWEIHGNKSDNTKESSKVIGELKDRVEKLQLCSERLKADKEALEDSFQYHSEQQAKLAIELIGKMRNLQEISVQADDTTDDKHETGKRAKSVLKCCPENVIKLHDLSTRLLEKARELELALVERTKQICRLRWELLNREVSAMKMKTELHSTQLQDGNRTFNVPTANIRRSQYGQRRSWSSSERLNYRQPGIKGNHSGLDVDSWIISENWPKIQKETSELSETVQQLKMELLKLASQAQTSRTGSSSEGLDEGERIKIEEMKGINELFTSSLNTDMIPDDYSKNNYSDETKFISRHHQNSGDNISSFSGPEGSESSSLNDAERTSYVIRLPRNRWRRSHDNVSSSSESSFKDEESFTVAEWCRPRTNSHYARRTKVLLGNNKKGTEEQEGSLESQKSEELTREMVLSYGNHSISRSSSELTDQRNDSWGELYKHRLFFNHFSETSSSTHNEGFEESSSASMNNPFQSYNYDTPDSTQSNLRSSSSSGHDRYIGIPMIDEDYPGGSIGGDLSNLGPKSSEFQVIPEGQVMSMAGEERRHSEPCRKFKYSIRSVNRNLVSNSAISIAEVKEDQSPSPIVYTIRLSPSRIGSKSTTDQDDTNCEELDELLETPTTEYVLCEPKENIFFTQINRNHPPSSPPKTPLNQENLDSFNQKPELELANTENISTSSLTSISKSEFLEPLSIVSQDNRSPSTTSLTSLGSERSIVKSRTSQDSQVSFKEKDASEITRTSSRSSLTSKVASFINRRSRSKSRSRSESTKQSAIGVLCRQSLALTVDPKTINETKIRNYSNVIVTEALKSAATTATATISMAPSMSSFSLLPTSLSLSSNDYAASKYQQFQSDHK